MYSNTILISNIVCSKGDKLTTEWGELNFGKEPTRLDLSKNVETDYFSPVDTTLICEGSYCLARVEVPVVKIFRCKFKVKHNFFWVWKSLIPLPLRYYINKYNDWKHQDWMVQDYSWWQTITFPVRMERIKNYTYTTYGSCFIFVYYIDPHLL